LSPGLATRTATFVLVDPVCETLPEGSGTTLAAGSGVGASTAPASGSLEGSCPVISGSDAGDTMSDAGLAWLAEGLSPGLSTRIEALTLFPSVCASVLIAGCSGSGEGAGSGSGVGS
jgi:hypothetical protein